MNLENIAKMTKIKIPATYMRGGTSKGLFFKLEDLPKAAQSPGFARDQLLLRIIGSPDPYGKHTDGMGGATSSTSKVVILSKSEKSEYDVDYLFGQVSIDKPFIDWSGNCGNLTAAVGSFAITNGLMDDKNIQQNGIATIRIWQANIDKRIIAHVPINNGMVQEFGNFELDGVTFPSAEVAIEFIKPIDKSESMFPTGDLIEILDVPGLGHFQTTMINAGIPTIFLNAEDLGYHGAELQKDINEDPKALEIFEKIRSYGALRMGLIKDIKEAKNQQHTPKIAFIAKPKEYISSSGKKIYSSDVELNVRALSMGKLHHAMMGTAAVAIGSAAAIPGTLISQAIGNQQESITFGHPSGILKVNAEAQLQDNKWTITKVGMSRSARILMEGWVHIPQPY